MKLTREQLNKLDKADLVDLILQLQIEDAIGKETPNYVPTYPYVYPNGSSETGDYPNNPYVTWTSYCGTDKTNTK